MRHKADDLDILFRGSTETYMVKNPLYESYTLISQQPVTSFKMFTFGYSIKLLFEGRGQRFI